MKAADWVPANAKIHIDLVGGTPQGRAWVEGTGEVAVSTVLGTDPNTEGGWQSAEYDPAKLVANYGYGTANVAASPLTVALIGAARALVVAGATVRVQQKRMTTVLSGGTITYALASADANSGIQFIVNDSPNSVKGTSWNLGYDVAITGLLNNSAGAQNVVAATFLPTRAALSNNGSSPALSQALTPEHFPTSGDSPIVCSLFEIIPNNFLQSATIYPPQPDAALPGLSGLSEPPSPAIEPPGLAGSGANGAYGRVYYGEDGYSDSHLRRLRKRRRDMVREQVVRLARLQEK